MEHNRPPGTAAWSGVRGGHTVAEGEVMIQKGLQDPKVKFLREQLEKAGCKITDNFFKSVRCDTPMSGFFCPKSNGGIQVCANNLRFQDEVTQVLIHELIHAYDQCRAKNMDWGNRTHRACTEIRASHLSGDCHFLRELLRGNFKIIGHEQACVKRRVVNSMTGTNTNCSKIAATIAMEVVWDTCYNDTAPFDKAP
ncbi:PREDICTED: mitochondrial inner membrane protease ATP23-like [Ipomoea nil]|uniref:mitochondrial inner membrane protease ATP23-like n=1 Tax=Ipomoea nil TaxID=35883 RepID=UPI000900A204|nr:PREDICTED: mitochondrial inner membrane protease ATP23-like [Ipomoea nil]